MTLNNRPYSAGHFELQIDGQVSTAYLKSFEGGNEKCAVIEERFGHENEAVKHLSVSEIEPMSLELGMSGAKDILKWIQQSWRKNPETHRGQVTHADFDLYATETHEFFEAAITETTFPTLDGASKDGTYLKIKIHPERVVTTKVRNKSARIRSNLGSKQKLWSAANFELKIDGIDEFKFANKIESFTIKQSLKPFYSGEEDLPELVPTKITFPHISGTLAAGYCDSIHKWRKDSIGKGSSDPSVQKSGALMFKDPTTKEILFSIQLSHVGLFDFKMMPSTANSDQIKRAKFELMIGAMDIDGKGTLGLE